ncbi:MAG: hypothetical protein V6Z86_07105, partial [Hyphomicrobiales bacterium]
MTDTSKPMGEIGEILARAKQAAVDYYRLTGKPLGITGKIGEYEAARLLGLTLADTRTPGYDATDESGLRYQIKARTHSRSRFRRLVRDNADLPSIAMFSLGPYRAKVPNERRGEYFLLL